MKNYFGIDFGTTNSAIVRYDEEYGLFKTIGDNDDDPIPSVVAVERLAIDNQPQQVICGRAVKEKLLSLIEGRRHLVIQSVKTALASEARWQTASRLWDAQAIAAELFNALSERARQVAGAPIEEAVIAIPIGFPIEKRAIIRQAAAAAGIRIAAFISEPTAAFIAHLDDLRHCRYVAVFDWGGGTLDISILELRGNSLLERYTDGWDCAGDYLDELLAREMHCRIAESGTKRDFDSLAAEERQRLLNEAERCKRALQERRAVRFEPGAYADYEDTAQEIAQAEWNGLIAGIVKEAVGKLLRAVERANLAVEAIDKLLVVGGTSKLAALERELRARWKPQNFVFPEDADWSVAKGAAWLAAQPGSYETGDSLGLVLADDEYFTVFETGTLLEQAACDLHFGLVEESRTATFLFASQNGGTRLQNIGELHVEAFGFRDEIITLASRITDDLVFQAIARSQSQAPSAARHFTYDKLKWKYRLPDARNGGNR